MVTTPPQHTKLHMRCMHSLTCWLSDANWCTKLLRNAPARANAALNQALTRNELLNSEYPHHEAVHELWLAQVGGQRAQLLVRPDAAAARGLCGVAQDQTEAQALPVHARMKPHRAQCNGFSANIGLPNLQAVDQI